MSSTNLHTNSVPTTTGPSALSKNALILYLNELAKQVTALRDENNQLKMAQEWDQVQIAALEVEMAGINNMLNNMKAQPMQEASKGEDEEGELDEEMRKRLELNNDLGIKTVCSYITSKGAAHVPAMVPVIAAITQEDLYDRVSKCFQEMAKSTHKAVKKEESVEPMLAAMTVNGEEAGEGTGKEVKRELKKLVKQSWQKGKCTIWQCKYDNLPADHILKDPKFAPALTYMLMSEDDNVYEVGELVMRKYECHAPMYHSTELTNFYTSLDKEKDPAPTSQYLPCVQGEAIDIPPPTTNQLKNKACCWMIDLAWLAKEENIKYDILSYEEDPEDLEAKAKKMKQEKQNIKKKQDIKKKMRLDEDGNGKATATGGKKDKHSRKAAPVSTAALAATTDADGDWSD
ncbi:hypothetical protein EV421DRAFT_1744691 [Armillaria borealis]|uniref:Uncharacterized protein n=1 Tax=Armillaria borealis TaxID=47425 RepID=A0AA39IUF4_9AGAR|nr:hypothetical protein EV421DRAFT_1744691 [Armillaria borealis]